MGRALAEAPNIYLCRVVWARTAGNFGGIHD